MSAEEFVARSIAGQEKLLAIAGREKVVTGVASIATFVLTAIAIVAPWSTWALVMVSLSLGWFASRHLRARHFIRATTSTIARLRGQS